MVVYVCQDSFEGILTGIYDAWMSRKGHENVRLELEGFYQPELFCDYVEAAPSAEKFEKVAAAVRHKLSDRVYEHLYIASLSQEPDRADKMYRFLIDGFRYGEKVLSMINRDSVYEIFKMCRFVWNESHRLKEFVRFSKASGDYYISRIGPESDVLPLLAEHFADRLSGENWMIYDERRKKAAVHRALKGWFITFPGEAEQKAIELSQNMGEDYEDLWKIFYDAVAIKERVNPVCQRNHLPLRFRPYMTEFKDSF